MSDHLQSFLADRDEPCPNCRYSLRGVTVAMCPQCKRKLSLQLCQRQQPRRHFGLMYTLLGVALGYPLFNLINWFIQAWRLDNLSNWRSWMTWSYAQAFVLPLFSLVVYSIGLVRVISMHRRRRPLLNIYQNVMLVFLLVCTMQLLLYGIPWMRYWLFG